MNFCFKTESPVVSDPVLNIHVKRLVDFSWQVKSQRFMFEQPFGENHAEIILSATNYLPGGSFSIVKSV